MGISQFIHDVGQYAFLQHALVLSLVLGVGCGVVGCFIILRGLALMGDAISHAVIPGVAVSYMLKVSYFFGAVVFGLFAALSMGFIREHSKIKSDAAIGIVFSSFLALGILLITKIQSSIDLTNILFGNILTVRQPERWLAYGSVTLIVLAILLFYRQLKLAAFDPVMAQVSGLPVRWINYAMILMLTVITVVSLQTVGAILVVAMLITPASTAYLLTQRFSTMLWLSAGLGMLSSLIGLYLSVTYNLASGVVIVLTAAAFFLLAFLFAPKNGVIWTRSKAGGSRIGAES